VPTSLLVISSNSVSNGTYVSLLEEYESPYCSDIEPESVSAKDDGYEDPYSAPWCRHDSVWVARIDLLLHLNLESLALC